MDIKLFSDYMSCLFVYWPSCSFKHHAMTYWGSGGIAPCSLVCILERLNLNACDMSDLKNSLQVVQTHVRMNAKPQRTVVYAGLYQVWMGSQV
jgi:hypothetical protein